MSGLATWRRRVALAGLLASVAAFPIRAHANYELGRGYSLVDGIVTIGGYFSLEAEFLDDTSDRPQIDEFSTFLTFRITDRWFVSTEMEAEDSVHFDGDRVGSGKDVFRLERFYSQWLAGDHLRLCAGRMLTPMGIWNFVHAQPLVWSTSRPRHDAGRRGISHLVLGAVVSMATPRPSRVGVRASRAFVAAVVAATLLCNVTAGAEESPAAPAPVTPAASAAPSVPVVPSVRWAVIVHPDIALRSMTREELERIYRKRNRFWPDHSAILPINLPGNDPLRRAFTTEILRSDEAELATYWNREYFQGVAPPPVLHSSGAVRAYVAATPGAIGYVSSEVIDSSVAVVEVTNDR